MPNNFSILGIYRSPSFKNPDNFLNSLDLILTSEDSSPNVVLAGDINIDILPNSHDPRKTEYLCLMAEHGLNPAITIPTRITSCIDHIFIKSKFKAEALVCTTSVADHDLPMVFINTEIKHRPTQKRQKTLVDYSGISKALELETWTNVLCTDDPSEASEKLTTTLNQIIEQHTKVITVSRSKHNIKPWITPGLIRCMKHRDKLHLTCRKSPNDPTAKLVYNRYKNFCNDLLHQVKSNYEKRLLEENMNNSKNLWKSIKSICELSAKTKSPNELLTCDDTPLKSLNKCNSYFSTVGASLAKDLMQKINKSESELASSIATTTSHVSFYLNPTDEIEVESFIRLLKIDSAPGLDGFRNSLIKHICKYIVVPLTHIINLSLKTGTFPDTWKTAVVTPIHKAGDKKTPSNYRPISLLSVFSKLLEKIVNLRLVKFLEANNLLSPVQFGFRQGKSTEDAASSLISSVSSRLDEGQHCIGVFLDLAKAFDTVSIKILLKKMECLGIRGHTLNWFESYLTNRYQRTKCNDLLSDAMPVNFGVPQGSILGPTLFLIYINELGPTLSSSWNAQVICYADDTALLFYEKTWEATLLSAERGLSEVSNWLNSNLLTLNTTKTKFLCFHKTSASKPKFILQSLKIHSTKCINRSQHCDCQSITRVDSLRYLGIIIDEKLSFSQHITALSNRARKLINIMRLLRNSADLQILKNVYTALCESVLSYCIPCWGGSTKSQMITIERAQRSILKVMHKKPRRFSTFRLFQESGVLSIRQLFILKVTVSQHRKSISSTDYYDRLSRRTFKLPTIRTNTNFAHRFSKYLHPHIYNKIQSHINIKLDTIHEAKKKTKRWLSNLNYEETENILKSYQT
ncbi:hypothetical protein JYU34_021418 [Plutella xylostella]|uniref:Reverse transcriptase domain-containing protein n=1 Tax=Plutella xylostella TaxID=51655 RepID=A0ABQ7PTI1_PLUXY|nr:hypothetical protein JYU34_021418 [Plutella xylostella]